MGTGLIRRHRGQLFGRRLAERAARSGEQDASYALAGQAGCRRIGQALEDGIVLTVDGQQGRATGLHGLDEERAAHDQGFLVGQQYALAGLDRSQGGLQTRRADDGRHDGIHLGMGRDGFQATLPHQDFGAGFSPLQQSGQLIGGRLIRHGCIDRLKTPAEVCQLAQSTMPAEGEDAVAIGMPGHDIQGAGADGARRTQDTKLLETHWTPQPAHQSSRANSGTAAVRLSMRSSTPPCPGSNWLLSLSPA